jgi:hypothetical protein
MVYRKLKDGQHVVGIPFEGRFIIYTSVFDAREGKALTKALRSIFELFNATSGAWVTMGPGAKEIPRGSTAKRKAREAEERASRRAGRTASTRHAKPRAVRPGAGGRRSTP